MNLNPVIAMVRKEIGEGAAVTLESLESAISTLLQGAEDLRERLGEHALATILEEQTEHLVGVMEEFAAQVLEDSAEPDVWPSVEEEFANIWQDYLQWQAGEWSYRGEDSYGTKKRLASLLRGVLLEVAVGVPSRRDVSDNQLIEAAQDALMSKKR